MLGFLPGLLSRDMSRKLMHDRSYWHNPGLSLVRWQTRLRPAVVTLDTSVDGYSKYRFIDQEPAQRRAECSSAIYRGCHQDSTCMDHTYCYNFF
jgi:hypothetical protein